MTFTKEQIHDAIITRHKEVFGYIGKDDESEEVHRDGYFIAGFVKDALDNFQRSEPVSLKRIVGRTNVVTCPCCEHELSDDEMYQSEVDLYALAPNEDDAIIDCPACHEKFTVHGSYTPIYETLPLEME